MGKTQKKKPENELLSLNFNLTLAEVGFTLQFILPPRPTHTPEKKKVFEQYEMLLISQRPTY